MRYCVSDVHGEYDLFLRLLQKIRFSDADELLICGDIIDKGQDSVQLSRLIFSCPNMRCIMGNHEHAFVKQYHALMQSSPEDYDAVLEKLQAYFPHDGHLLDWETVDRFDELPYYIEEDTFICVHAGAPLDKNGMLLPLENATPEQLVNDRRFKDPEAIYCGDKCVLFGHTPTNYICGADKILVYRKQPNTKSSQITDYYKIHLDTGTWLNGVLGCFCIDTCRAIYVNK